MAESTGQGLGAGAGRPPDALAEAQEVVDRLVGGRAPLMVLEAGCGSRTHVALSAQAHIVGIDISRDQLDRNDHVHEAILGDIQTHVFDEGAFDLIICWDVLEHLPNPDKALASFVRAVKPEGVILLAVPNVRSLKGLITRFTPHWFHVWVYRSVFKSEDAGRPGCAPFPTSLSPTIAPSALTDFARDNGLVVEYARLYESAMIGGLKRRSRLLHALYRAVLAGLKAITLGHYDGAMSDFIMVLRKPAHARH